MTKQRIEDMSYEEIDRLGEDAIEKLRTEAYQENILQFAREIREKTFRELPELSIHLEVLPEHIGKMFLDALDAGIIAGINETLSDKDAVMARILDGTFKLPLIRTKGGQD